MATPADQRLLELLEKWLKSLELHAKYSSLDDDSYWKIQPWTEHQRPSRWIIDLAMQKTVALRTHVEDRVKQGDAKFSDSLELMIFLANLVGSEHIERFIPVAEAQNERSLAPEPPDDSVRPPADAVTGTREMPKFQGSKRMPPAAGTAQVARTERKAAMPPKPAAKPLSKQPPRLGTSVKTAAAPKPAGKAVPKFVPAAPADREGPTDAARTQVIADAARLVQWGRKWYELPELIARMADRPSLPEVRRILKENKSAIDQMSGGK
jgi:hypothetical protein